MAGYDKQMSQTHAMPLSRTLHLTVYGVAGGGYLFALLSLEQLTLISLLLLTGTYGAWLALFHFQLEKRLDRRSHLWWSLPLLCLACVSLFIPLHSENVYWRPILPITTACLLVTSRPRVLGLLAALVLWLSTSLALFLLTWQWDIGGQAALLLTFLSIAGLVVAISELTHAHMRLQAYSAQGEELSVLRDRDRIAREIHDTLGHTLMLLLVQLETASQFEARSDPRLHEKLLQARQVAGTCLTDVRQAVEALRPNEASNGSLQEQLGTLVTTFETTCLEPQITLDLDEVAHPLNQDVCLTLYRCAQEALTNIHKHAHATRVLLRLSTNDEETREVELTVLDNGQGSGPSHGQSVSGFGLRGMRERVALLGGRFWAGPEPGHGWRVEVVLPLPLQEQVKKSTPGACNIKKEV